MELKNINEYNPQYLKGGSLVWKKIGEPTGKKGKHLRAKKHYPKIAIEKIVVDSPYQIDEEILNQSRNLYQQTKEMIPVYLAYDFKLIGGYEQYELAKELKLKNMPFQRITKMTKKETKQFVNSAQNKKIGNKKYKIKAEDGSNLFVSLNHAKKINDTKHRASKAKCCLHIHPDFTFALTDIDGNYVLGDAKHGLKLNVIRKNLEMLLKQRGDKKR